MAPCTAGSSYNCYYLPMVHWVLRWVQHSTPLSTDDRFRSTLFNLQAICHWNRRFIWVSMGHTASAHDSTVFKSTLLYKILIDGLIMKSIFWQIRHTLSNGILLLHNKILSQKNHLIQDSIVHCQLQE